VRAAECGPLVNFVEIERGSAAGNEKSMPEESDEESDDSVFRLRMGIQSNSPHTHEESDDSEEVKEARARLETGFVMLAALAAADKQQSQRQRESDDATICALSAVVSCCLEDSAGLKRQCAEEAEKTAVLILHVAGLMRQSTETKLQASTFGAAASELADRLAATNLAKLAEGLAKLRRRGVQTATGQDIRQQLLELAERVPNIEARLDKAKQLLYDEVRLTHSSATPPAAV
jgi:hypothetical protein